jgi:hypothetical protein
MKTAWFILFFISVSAAVQKNESPHSPLVSNPSTEDDPQVIVGDHKEEEEEPVDWWKQILNDKPKKTYFHKTGLWPCKEYVFDDQYQIRTRLETALTSDYFGNEEFPVHHAVFTFTVMDEGESVPLVDMPVEFKATKSRRAVYVIEKDQLKKIHFGTLSSETLWTNSNGQIRLSFKIKRDSDLVMQSFLFRTLDVHDWRLFRADTDTLQTLSRVTEASLQSMKPDLSLETAEFVKSKLSVLFGFAAKQHTAWYQPTKGFITMAISKQAKDVSRESVNEAWLRVKESLLNGIDILGLAANEFKRLLITLAKFTVYTLSQVISFAVELLRCVGLTLKALVDSLKVFVSVLMILVCHSMGCGHSYSNGDS